MNSRIPNQFLANIPFPVITCVASYSEFAGIRIIASISRFFSLFFQRNIDKTRVTCIKWIPGSQTSFIAAHSSGCMYVYNYDVLCPNTVPAYQLFKQGKGFTVYTCKTKTTRNPVYKWTIGKKGSKF
jgi:hypothetical protein